jgi:hypothetical protein
MTFDNLDSVIAFQGEDYQRCYVSAPAQKLLRRWDHRSSHYELLKDLATV